MANLFFTSMLGIYCLGHYIENPDDKFPGCEVTLPTYVNLLQKIVDSLGFTILPFNSTQQSELSSVISSLSRLAIDFQKTIKADIERELPKISALNRTTQAPATIPVPNIMTFNSAICEGNTTTLTCNNGATINITHADYGRDNSSVCVDVTRFGTERDSTGKIRSVYDSTDCKTKTDPNGIHWPTKYAEKNCNGQASCSLTASLPANVSDPCGGIFKFFTVQYNCAAKKA